MTDNQSVGSYENNRNHGSMPPVGEAQPAHMGSQSSVPTPQEDPRGYVGGPGRQDEGSFRRNFQKYPATTREKIQGAFESFNKMMGGKDRQ